MTVRVEKWPTFRVGAVSLLYLTAGLAATVLLVVSGDNSYFRPAHLAFVVALAVLAISTNMASVLIKRFLGNWGGLCLFGFLFYYLIMATGYPNERISNDHIRYLYSSVIPGFLIGFVAFGYISPASFRAVRIFPSGLRRFMVAAPIVIALFAYILLVVATFIPLVAIRRTDIFLITNLVEDDDIAYQLFGTYMLLAYCVAFSLAYRLYARGPAVTGRFLGFVSVQSLVAVVVGMSLALVGSTKELVALILMLVLTIAYAKPRNWIFRGTTVRLRNAALLAVLVTVCGGVVVWRWLSGFDLPPLALFGFQENTSILRHPSLVSRMDILFGAGLAQLSLSPILGDLGAEHIVGGAGRYIHSLISVQSHLGAIGAVCLLGFLVHRLHRIYGVGRHEALKVIAPPILFVAVMATFFVWMPFWFVVGALFAPYVSSQERGRTPRRA
ncbi:MAG: hypothetical protein A3J24_05070 [Deltaproteobacteria bacterium RIFCSPLOWO2_02_FULL_53_8]|nr:MAG: hypothetical protein A3J24_05070 [Deltaproteobacteria bacterium RIFCSPLOWO2_02_FULL_53_8]